MTKKLGTDFYKSKGVVKSLVDEYTALVDVDGMLLLFKYVLCCLPIFWMLLMFCTLLALYNLLVHS